MVGEYEISKNIFLYCMRLVELVHDALDMNIVPALLNMAAKALMTFEITKGAAVAMAYLLVAESTCEALGTTDSEVSYLFHFVSFFSCSFLVFYFSSFYFILFYSLLFYSIPSLLLYFCLDFMLFC